MCQENSTLKAQAQSALHSEAKANRKCANLWKFISVRHRLAIPAADGSIRKILREAEGKMSAILVLIAMLSSFSASAQPLLRQFFTTNPAPVVQTTAGSNVFVTFSTAGQTRTYKIDVPLVGGISNIYVAAGTGVTITTNGALYTFSVSTNYASTNYVNTATNDLNTALTNRINTATNDVATRTANATNDLNTLVKTYTNAVGIIQIITNASPLAMSITGNASTATTVPASAIDSTLLSWGYTEEFVYSLPATGARFGELGLQPSVGNSGATGDGAVNTSPGSILLSTGTAAANGSCFLGNGGGGANNPYPLSGTWTNEWRFSISATNNPASTNNYSFRCGFSTANGSTFPASCAIIYYFTNDSHFQYVSAQGSSYTTNITGLVPSASTYYRFRVVTTATGSGTNVVFTINGANGWTNSTAATIPIGAFVAVGIEATIVKNDGTGTARTADVDYCYLGFGLTSTR